MAKKKSPKGRKPTTTKDLTVKESKAVSGGGKAQSSDFIIVKTPDKSSP